MSSRFIEHSPERDDDKSLILIMDKDGNVTTDPVNLEKILCTQNLPEMGIKLVRVDSNQTENGNKGDDSKEEVNLTVEEIYPESLALSTGESAVISSPLEILPGPSNENITHDMVDPFSEMDSEQLQRLEHALASEQAKQILGENVAAMLDMLSVEDNPAAFLQNTIKNDHCYTNLLPSSDPNGPSFFLNDVRTNGESSKGKGKAKVGTPIKGKKVVPTTVVGSGGTLAKRQVTKDVPVTMKTQQNKQTTLLDYKISTAPVQTKSQNEIEEDPSYEEDVDVEDSDGSSGVDDDNLSDEDYNNRSTRGKRKPRKNKKKLLMKKNAPGRPVGRPLKSGSRFGRRPSTTPEVRARNEKLDDAMSKIVQSLDYDSKDGEEKIDFKRGPRKIKTYKSKHSKEEPSVEPEKVVKEAPKPVEDSVVSPSKAQSIKYPKRENRKPPAHLVENLGPALFSAPDIIRRISTSEEIPQTPPEKKNFTVGVYSNPKLTEKVVVKTPIKTEVGLSEPLNHVKEKDKVQPKESPQAPKVIKTEPGEVNRATKESREEKVVAQKSPVGNGDGQRKANLEIQKLLEKHQIKQELYNESEDSFDENVEENYYLDPTQMDQSLLEGFGQTTIKSEDQLLQEAILLQEQLIESNKPAPLSGSSNVDIEDAQVEMPFETETIEDIQNEITSAILVAPEGTESKQNYQIDSGAKKTVLTNNTNSNKMNRVGDNMDQNELEGIKEDEEGNLIVDENRLEDRRRNSAKRRRSDEVSDLDSDLDDALSEASWNSEDDPDRLWCICRKPHNNRFMICCDVCEEWFHGKCVGITKSIGKQMEQDGLEWSCPNCTKKKKMEENVKEAEKIKVLKEKMAQSIKEQQQKIREKQKIHGFGPKDKSMKSVKNGSSSMKQTKISDFSQTSSQGSEEEETVGRKCIMCKGPVRENSIYCSDDCIRKHSQHAISQLMADGNKKSSSDSSSTGQGDNSKLVQKVRKEESRIVVMDSNSKKFLVGQNAPTAANLTTWLKENPSYQVVYKKSDKPAKLLVASRKLLNVQSKPGETQKVFVQKISDSVKSTQLKLAVSPNSKQINILQPSGVAGKKIYQIVQTTTGGKQTAFVVKPKQELITKPKETVPMPPVKPMVAKVPVKIREVSSPKVASALASLSNSSGLKPEKIQKKRKDRMQRSSTSSASGKDSKSGPSTKQDDGKDKEKDKKDADQQIRDSVKKTLAETLKARVHECKDLEYNEEHIETLALKIEEKLFRHFECKVDTKYKSKYRSLVFNIKDPKNETLYRKIVDNSISPKELVKLSPEELASQELARWREKENQHQLEMIKKTELELMTKGNTYIMKSHKGEQVIESDQSEKVAAVAAEIDPNTPAQELVSALNSVTSTTQDANEEEEKNKETSLTKMKRKEKERRRSRDKKHDRRDKERRRSSSRSSRSSRSKSHHSKDKKRSRSRDRDRDRDRSRHRHRDRKSEKKRERDSKEESESMEEKPEEKFSKYDVTTPVEVEDKTNKKTVEDDEADREPSSTVIIKTPDINTEEQEPTPLWKGTIVMADVAKFSGFATEISGDCGGLSVDIGEKAEIVGRIPFNTVWDYIARMKKMGTKDILVIKIAPVKEEEKGSYETLYNYLSKRSRIGVIGKTSEAVKDFYLYPLASHTHLPQVLLPLEGPPFEGDGENILLGIIVRNKHKSKHLRTPSIDSVHLPTSSRTMRKVDKIATIEEESVGHRPEKVPDRSYTPPLPDKEQEELLRKERQKRKIRCRVEFKEKLANEEEEEAVDEEDDDSPYSPGDSDDDLAPLPKIAKTSMSSISTSLSKLLSPGVSNTVENLQDPAEIQRKIDEMNRAIEEQTQQIQSLTSAVPKLAAGTILPSLPLLATVTSAIITPALSPSSVPLPRSESESPQPSHPPATAPTKPSTTENVQLPLISEDLEEEVNSPQRSFTPPLKVQENIPFLPEVTSKIALPSNLQEILNSVQPKKPEETEPRTKEVVKSVEEIVKNTNPDIDLALNVLNQTKSLLNSLAGSKGSDGAVEKEEKSTESPAILSRLTDQELMQKAQEMEMETAAENALLLNSINPPCPPPQLCPPSIQDIPLLPPSEAFQNPPPPFFTNPLLSSGPIVEPAVVKSLTGDSEGKKPEKRMKLDPKSVFENEGVPDFVNIPSSNWDDKKGGKNFKIDIKLAMNTLERKTIDMDHFDIESISKVQEVQEMETKAPVPSGSGISERKSFDDTKYDSGGERSSKSEYRSSHDRDRRRSVERKGSDWKYERRHWDESRRYKEDYRRHGRRDRPQKFRKERFDDRRNRHLQKEWDGSIKNFEERQRWRNQDMRRDETRKVKKRSDSFTN